MEFASVLICIMALELLFIVVLGLSLSTKTKKCNSLEKRLEEVSADKDYYQKQVQLYIKAQKERNEKKKPLHSGDTDSRISAAGNILQQ